MDVLEALESRISCRAFLDKPLDLSVVTALIEPPARAASRGKRQPWRIHALRSTRGGEWRRRVAARRGGCDPRHVEAEYPIYPKELWEPFKGHREHHGVQLYGALEIDRNDADARIQQYKENFK